MSKVLDKIREVLSYAPQNEEIMLIEHDRTIPKQTPLMPCL
ncbi:MAG: hypothetical protein ACM3UY_08690 [Methanocella sp.]|jgi:hypothetical protein